MDDDTRLTFRFSDTLPGACVVCGAAATGQTSLQVDLPPDEIAKQMTILQFIGLLLKQVDKSGVQDPDDYLRGLERDL